MNTMFFRTSFKHHKVHFLWWLCIKDDVKNGSEKQTSRESHLHHFLVHFFFTHRMQLILFSFNRFTKCFDFDLLNKNICSFYQQKNCIFYDKKSRCKLQRTPSKMHKRPFLVYRTTLEKVDCLFDGCFGVIPCSFQVF